MALDDLSVLELTAEDPRKTGVVGPEADRLINEASGGDPTSIDQLVVDFSLVRDDLERASDIDAERLRIKNTGVVSAMEAISLQEQGVALLDNPSRIGAFSEVPTASGVQEVTELAGQKVRAMVDNGVKRSRELLTRLIKDLNTTGTQAQTKADEATQTLAEVVNLYLEKHGFKEYDFQRRSNPNNTKPLIGSITLGEMTAMIDPDSPDVIDVFLQKLASQGWVNPMARDTVLTDIVRCSDFISTGDGHYNLEILGHGQSIDEVPIADSQATNLPVSSYRSERLFFHMGKPTACKRVRQLGGAMLGMANYLTKVLARLDNEGEQYTLAEVQDILPQALQAAQLAKVLFTRMNQCLVFNQYVVELYNDLNATV